MYIISAQRYFEAAHALRGYQGKCERIHGHRFKVVAKLRGETLNDVGLAYDFTNLKKNLDQILARYDHTSLNEVPPFDKINPSSENIARTIYEKLAGMLSENDVELTEVDVWESPDQWVTYIPD
ncbi:6-carboxytetrahydropterin synthase QueD [Chloroflexota bacterium]